MPPPVYIRAVECCAFRHNDASKPVIVDAEAISSFSGGRSCLRSFRGPVLGKCGAGYCTELIFDDRSRIRDNCDAVDLAGAATPRVKGETLSSRSQFKRLAVP